MPKGIVLITCGSFNPVTKVHLRMYEVAKNYFFNLNYNFFKGIMSPVHEFYFHKRGKLLSSKLRCDMINLAIQEFNQLNKIEESYVICDDWESKQTNWMYTIDVLNHFKEIYNDEYLNEQQLPANTEMKLLCGADTLQSMTTDVWSEYHKNKILQHFGMVVITRYGVDVYNLIKENEFLKKYKDRIIVIENKEGYEDSSTKVRNLLKEGKIPADLVYSRVIDYILEKKLFV